MILRKVSAKEIKYREIKEKNLVLIEDFEEFAQKLTNQAGRSSKSSGKARSYANTLIKLIVLYDENMLIEKSKRLDIFEILQRIIYIESRVEFKKFNKSEGHFPSATINCFIRYSEYEKIAENSFKSEVNEFNQSYTEVEAKVLQRVGQSEFKKLLVNKYETCALCKLNADYTIASHIKPWMVSNDYERLDRYNGFLMCPNHDYLFDRGFVTINNYGDIRVSNQLLTNQISLFNIPTKINIPIENSHKKYLDYHRVNIYLK